MVGPMDKNVQPKRYGGPCTLGPIGLNDSNFLG